MRFPGGVSLLVLRPSPPDQFGDRVPDVQRWIHGVGVQYGAGGGSQQESEDRGITVRQDVRLFLPPGEDLAATDRVVLDGLEYDVNGNQQPRSNPFTGWRPGAVVALSRRAG